MFFLNVEATLKGFLKLKTFSDTVVFDLHTLIKFSRIVARFVIEQSRHVTNAY